MTGPRPRRTSPLADIEMLTVAEVARAARVSEMTIRRLVTSGALESVLVAERCLRIPEPAARRLLTGQPASQATP